MHELPEFTVCPPLRCCAHIAPPGADVCGAPAIRQRSLPDGRIAGWFCPRHELATDEPIADVVIFRRVSLQVEVLFAGISPDRALATAEALRALELAVESVGGVLSLTSATSVVGRYGRPGGAVRHRVLAGEGEG